MKICKYCQKELPDEAVMAGTRKQRLVYARCGYAGFRALRFHHLDGSGKSFNVSEMATGGLSGAMIQCEIDEVRLQNFRIRMVCASSALPDLPNPGNDTIKRAATS